jgi:hypothetical protein
MMARPVPIPIKLTDEERIVAERFFSLCDGRADGFRFGMEQAKQMFVQFLIAQRKEASDA